MLTGSSNKVPPVMDEDADWALSGAGRDECRDSALDWVLSCSMRLARCESMDPRDNGGGAYID
jgi:hypothetical protein